MKKFISATIIIVAMSAASSIEAQECGQLFIKAAKDNQRMVDRGQRVFRAVQDRLDGKAPAYFNRYNPGRRWPMKDRYEYLADKIAQWGVSWALDSMTAALECALPMVPACKKSVFRASLAKVRLANRWKRFRQLEYNGFDGVGWARGKRWLERYLHLSEEVSRLPFQAYFRAVTPAVLCFKGTFGG